MRQNVLSSLKFELTYLYSYTIGVLSIWESYQNSVRNLSDLKVCQKLSDQAFQRTLAMVTPRLFVLTFNVHVHADEKGNCIRHGRREFLLHLFAPSFVCSFCFYHLLRQHSGWCAFLPSLMPFLLSLLYHLCTHQCQKEWSRRASSVRVDRLDTTLGGGKNRGLKPVGELKR